MLAPVSDYLRGEVAAGKIPGAILLIQQHGKPVVYEKFGLRNVKTAQPMTDDTSASIRCRSRSPRLRR
jgi:hypothetical protein